MDCTNGGCMGTNYYLVKNGPSVREPVHIGKSSSGWLFNFQSQNQKWEDPPIVWNTWKQVCETLARLTVDSTEYVIIDEYDEVIPMEDFVDLVLRKQEDEWCRGNPDNFSYSRNIDGFRFSDEEFC